MSGTAVTVVPADSEVVDRLADMWVALARDQRGHGSHLRADTNRTRVRELLARYTASEGLLVAATDTDSGTGAPVGFVMFRVRSGQYEVDTTRGLVENLYVGQGHRDNGVGSALLEAAERRLGERGVDVVSLEVMAPNEAARRFYRRHGYEPHRVELEKSVDDGSETES